MSDGTKIRKFPIALLIAATVFLYLFSFYSKKVIFYSLAELTLSMSLFLVLVFVFCEIKKLEFKVPLRLKTLFKKKKQTEETAQAGEEAPVTPTVAGVRPIGDGLTEIPKETVVAQTPIKTNLFLRIAEITYILFFCGMAFWRIFRMIAVMHIFTDPRSTIIDAVLLLVFPGIAIIYLNMVKGNAVNTKCDTVSSDMLRLFSGVSFVYAALIAVASVLKINSLGVLPWVFCVALIYIIIALALNMLSPILKRQNFSLKSLYTIKYAVKILPGLILGLGLVLFLSTTVFVVQPHQQALVYRLGILNGPSSVVGEGLHFKFPWPIDKADIYDVHRVNSMQIGYEAPYRAHNLWTRPHEGGENTLLTGNGNELVAVNIKIMYTINDLYRYVINCTKPESVLSAAAYEALMLRTVDTTLDEFLSVDRNSLSVSMTKELSEFCESNGLGLSVQQVIVESIHPPVDIADIYQRVVTAIVIKNTMITRATTTAQRRIIEAQELNKTVVDNAIARKYNRISEAQKEMAVYYAAMEAYNINPQCLEFRKYLDTYEKIINGNKVYVFSPGMEASIAKAVIGKTNVIGVNYE